MWALASRKCGSDLFLVAGSAGGQLTTWRDVTESAVLQQQATAARTVVDQQKLANLLVSQQYGKALQLALRQEHLPQVHFNPNCRGEGVCAPLLRYWQMAEIGSQWRECKIHAKWWMASDSPHMLHFILRERRIAVQMHFTPFFHNFFILWHFQCLKSALKGQCHENFVLNETWG